MSVLLQRASLLFEQERYDSAAEALREHLTVSPEDPQAHRLLALCLAKQDKLPEATQHAQQAIALDPADASSHYVLAVVLAERNRTAEALKAAQQAIAIEPMFASAYAMSASLHFRQRRWQPALEAADQGLAIDPDHAGCLNLRAMAEVKLGRSSSAATTLHDALQRNPDDPFAHANQGWICLEQGKPQEAATHFKEALRLDPNLEWARQGVVEALKARNFVYRWLLYYFLWTAKLPGQARFGIMVGGYFGLRWMLAIARDQPELAILIYPLIAAYLIFAVLSWMGDPFFNLLLRLDPLGRHALSEDQRRGAHVLLWLLAVVALVFVVGMATGGSWKTAGLGSLLAFAIAMPASVIYQCDRGWPRNVAWLAVAGITILGAPAILSLMTNVLLLPRGTMGGSVTVFIWCVVLVEIGMNFLTAATVRK